MLAFLASTYSLSKLRKMGKEIKKTSKLETQQDKNTLERPNLNRNDTIDLFY
jgi:hypothetical protein